MQIVAYSWAENYSSLNTITETFYLLELYLDLITMNSKTLPFLSPSSILFTFKIKLSVHN